MNEQQARYISFLSQFADGFQETELQMPKWLLYTVVTSSPQELEEGLRRQTVRNKICEKHPNGSALNQGNITQALQSAASLQVKKDIKPIILDYDQTNQRLNVVDRGFLIWMKYQDAPELLEHIGLES